MIFEILFNSNTWARGTNTISALLDSFNGFGFLMAPKSLGKMAGISNVPASVTDLMGIAFLGAAVGRVTTLMNGDDEALQMHCRNAIFPLSVLSLTLLKVPFKASPVNRMAALSGVGAPLTAAAGLTFANYQGWKKNNNNDNNNNNNNK